MNYLRLIRNFWRLHQMHQFSTTEIALYLYLLEVCNICDWTNPFKRNNARISADLGISRNTLITARNKLMQALLIKVDSKKGNANVTYMLLCTSSEFDEVRSKVSIQVTTNVDSKPTSRSTPIKDKQNKTR